MARKRKIRKSLRKNGLRSKTKRHRSYRKRNTIRRNTRRRNTRRRNTRRRNTRRHIGGSDGSTAGEMYSEGEMGMPVSNDFVIYSPEPEQIIEYSGIAGFNEQQLAAYLDGHSGDTYIKNGIPGAIFNEEDVLHHHRTFTFGTYTRIPQSMKTDTDTAGRPSKDTSSLKSEGETTPRGRRAVPTK